MTDASSASVARTASHAVHRALFRCAPERGGCGLDLASLKMELRIGPDRLEPGEIGVRPDHGFTAFCPACGTAHDVPLDALGIVHRARAKEPGFVLWKTAGSLVPAQGGVIAIGELRLRFRQLEVLRPEEVCFPAVPVFRLTDGTFKVPDVPVMPAFVDCVDTGALAPAQVARGRYQVELPLHGLAAPVRVELPLLAADAGRLTTDPERDAFRGVNVRFWPRVPFRAWKRFFLSVAAVEPEGKKLFARERPLSVGWIDAADRMHEIAVETAGGASRVACTTERPRWLAMRLEERDRAAGGGLFLLPGGDATYAPALGLALGVDFGTSNTCIAYQDPQGQPHLLPFPSRSGGARDDVLFASGAEPRQHDAPDTWLPHTGFGPKGDLLPSEILLAAPTRQLPPDPERIRALRPIEEYAIPTAGVRVGYPERDHVISELKWRGQILPAQLREERTAAALQEVYLDLAVFFALGQIYAGLGEVAPANVDVRYAFPLVLRDRDRTGLGEMWNRVARRIGDATGLTVTVPDPAQAGDESNTAAVGGRLGFLDRTKTHGRLLVDVGGGTTDLVLMWPHADSQRPPITQYVTSFRYAGGTYVAALAGASEQTVNCLVAGTSIETLRRLIRESSQIRHVIESPAIVRPDKRPTAERRASLFFAYLVEYLARLVVAPFLTGEAPTQADGTWPDPFVVEMIPLGNGWGFAGVIDAYGEEHLITMRLAERVAQVIAEIGPSLVASPHAGPLPTGEREPRRELPRIEVVAQKLKALPHPKAAVAYGLLLGGAASGPTPMRRIVGYTTTVDGTRKVSWSLPVVGDGGAAPAGQAPIAKSSYLGWDAVELPSFPSGLPSPHAMDEGLRHTVRTLLDESAPRDEFQHRWLRRSPFEVLLEELFTKAIPNDGVPYG
ncbi:MAG: hypothetical protein IT379_00320 [Deltaproteobacteria bacterium]|nr:hypothetical protein [Deltaproteobacteria bacterium]